MENKSYTRVKKPQKRDSDTKVRVTGARAEEALQILNNLPGLQFIQEECDDCLFEIETDEHSLRLINKNSALQQSPPKLRFNLTNILSLSNLLSFTAQACAKDHITGTQKLLSKFEKKYSKDVQARANLSELKRLLESVNGLGDLPKHFLEIPYFEHFQVCQILILEKGMPNCLSLTFDRASGIKNEKVPTQKFNQLISQVKKSKNKIFSLSGKESELNVIGSYLGREFESGSHSVVLVVSRNDFLPTTEDERSHFEEISNSLFLVLDNILFSERFIQKENQMMSAIDRHPLAIVVFDSHGEMLYENEAAKTLENKDFSRATSYKIKKKTLFIFQRPEDEFGRDFLHLERISLLGELLNTLKHEVSNPLFGIELGAQVLAEDIPEEASTFDEIRGSVTRCRDIINNFHSLYQSPHKRTETDIIKLVEEILVLTKSETRQIKKSLLIDGTPRTELSSSLQDKIVIKTHPTWLGQIIFNLIINASQSLKSNEESRGKLIEIAVSHSIAGVKIEVSDNGPGIEPEKLPFVFKPFFTTKSQGTGLGLAICTNLVKKLSGSIEAHSDQKKPWTTFSIEFPYE